jgi:hypothetical protein
MERQFEPLANANEDPQANQIKRLEDFSKEHEISNKEAFVAYKIALSLFSEEKTDPNREEIKELAKMMDKFLKEGLDLARLAKLVSVKDGDK